MKMSAQHESLKRSEKIVDKNMHDVNRKCVANQSFDMDKLPGQKGLSIDEAPKGIKDVSLGKNGKTKGSKLSKACTLIPDSGGPHHLPQESARMVSARHQVLHVRSVKSVANVVCKIASTSDKNVSHYELKTLHARSSLASKLGKSDPEFDEFSSCLDKEPACTSSVAEMTKALSVRSHYLPQESARMLSAHPPSLRVRSAKSVTNMVLQNASTSDKKVSHAELKAVDVRSASTLASKLSKSDSKSDGPACTWLVAAMTDEKVRIDTQIRPSAARLKAEMEMKKQRKHEQEAAWMELEKMERSVDVADNFHVVRELEGLIERGPFELHQYKVGKSVLFGKFVDCKLRSPLESLGLLIKEEFSVGDDDEVDDAFGQQGDWEEGERR